MRGKSARAAERPSPSRHFGVVGAHGGAGTSTITRWLDPDSLGGTFELATGSQLPPDYIPVVVCQSTAFGMANAVQLLGSWHPDVPRPYLVVVRDAPLSLPRATRYRMRAVKPRVFEIVEVPYLVRLRELDTPAEGLDHKAVRKAARTLRQRLGLPE
ncbi:hypothetical protein [Streptomyces sp. NPDC127103]|uniref:hypothetical protein n=1 Tax=Streptomyces sp. NPDC127103 TaxID=3347139 RepID=UPI00365477C1